jgi:hypothetical protein
MQDTMHPGGALLIKAEFNELIKFKELPLCFCCFMIRKKHD